MGFSDARGETGKDYANIEEASESRIMTFDDVNDKKRAAREMDQKLNAIKNQRVGDVPGPIMRIGGAGGGMQP